jgi:predicted oxidoreductase (fatty acid repression mutant protein)
MKEGDIMQVQEAIKARLSIRRYADTSIPDKDVKVLLKALQLSPSANNSQNWEFIFVYLNQFGSHWNIIDRSGFKASGPPSPHGSRSGG